jgi:hypothetical protein
MKNDPSLVKIALPFGNGDDAWIQATPTCLAFVDFRADSDGIECLRVATETSYEKLRAITALRSAADFLESKLDKSGEVFTNARI